MPKLKTNKGAAKRFSLTSKGKIRRKKSCASHILTKKNAKRKRRLGRRAYVSKEEQTTIKRLIPFR